MDRLKLERMSKEIEGLMEEFKNVPGILIIHPAGESKTPILFFGNPSVEWISKAGEGFAWKLETAIRKRQLRGT